MKSGRIAPCSWIGSALCGLLMAGASLAAPPAARPAASDAALLRGHAAQSNRSPTGITSRLDLRAPAQVPLTHDVVSQDVVFPSVRRAPLELGPRDAAEPASMLAAAGPQMAQESKAQELARRLHREGLPVARLWETHSALVSLGLNPRGKPGLWLIQKTH